jgi:hypothetical protein
MIYVVFLRTEMKIRLRTDKKTNTTNVKYDINIAIANLDEHYKRFNTNFICQTYLNVL